MRVFTIYTDGGCNPNPGYGGWAAIIKGESFYKEVKGSEPGTTNNRMELRAAVEALSIITEPAIIHINTDSKYLKDGITSWIHKWNRNGWRTSERQPVKNADLWRALGNALGKHQIQWNWVKGHGSCAENNRCDFLATEEVKMAKSSGFVQFIHTSAPLIKFETEEDRNRQALMNMASRRQEELAQALEENKRLTEENAQLKQQLADIEQMMAVVV